MNELYLLVICYIYSHDEALCTLSNHFWSLWIKIGVLRSNETNFHCPVGKNPSEFWSMLRVNHYRVEERKGFWIHLHHLLFALTPLTPSPQGKILRCLRNPTTLLSECLSCSVMFLSVFWFVSLNMKPLPQNLLKCWIILPLCDYKLVRYKLTPLYVRCARTRL